MMNQMRVQLLHPPQKKAKHTRAANTVWSPAMESQLIELMLKFQALTKMCDSVGGHNRGEGKNTNTILSNADNLDSRKIIPIVLKKSS
jgi:hypothetical protein